MTVLDETDTATRHWLWLTWAFLAILMAGIATWIYEQEKESRLDAATLQIDTEIGYLNHLLGGSLRNGALDQVPEQVEAWGRLNVDTLSLTVTADNGFDIAHFSRKAHRERSLVRSVSITFSYSSSVVVRLEKSLESVFMQIDALGYRLLIGTVLFQVLALLLVQQLYQQRRNAERARQEYEARVDMQRDIERMASQDPLTALPNRRAVEFALQSRVDEAKRYGRRLAVLFIDLDNFKHVNDSFGHDVGDELLKVTAERMSNCLRGSDLLARFGGDEFIVLLTNIDDDAQVEHVASKLLDSVRPGVALAGTEMFVSATIGISLYPEDAEQPADLLRHADAAMYRAKESGRDCFRFFTRTLNERMRAQRAIETGLHRALENQELYLVYQPKLELATQEIRCCEALLRWRHNGIDIPPGEFIPVAERSVLMRKIDEFVIEQAIRQRARWSEQGINDLSIDINLSGQRLLVGDTIAQINRALEDQRVSPNEIGIELTEHTLIEATDETIQGLSDLRERGCRVSLDDFGTGYSSLGYLKRLPVDVLKIDRGFIHELPANAQDASIVAAICAMGKSLGKRILAEGVETESQLECVQQHGCEMIQGYLLSRPQRADAFIDWLSEHRKQFSVRRGRISEAGR